MKNDIILLTIGIIVYFILLCILVGLLLYLVEWVYTNELAGKHLIIEIW